MNYELISEQEYAGLPEEDEQCFVEFESICRRNMTRMIDQDSPRDFVIEVRSQYMSAVAAVAIECSIPNISLNEYTEDSFFDVFAKFSLCVQGEIARIRVRGRRLLRPLSVQLTENTRTKIEHYISRLREVISTSDLPTARKAALDAKLDEFVTALADRRLSFGKAFAFLGPVLVGLAAATTVAAEGPAAINNIMKLITIDKESEDEAGRRLAPPPRALPAPQVRSMTASQSSVPSWDAVAGGDLEDEIPF